MIDEENQLENAQTSTVGSEEASSSTDTFSPETGHNGEVRADAAMAEGENAVAGEPGSAESSFTVGAEEQSADFQLALAEKDNQIQALKAQLEERTSQLMRNAADFDNYRKRTQREREELEQKVKCDTINELLPVVDNFERARSQFKPQTDQENTIHKGYQGVYKQLVECLKRIGVSPMRSEGKEFDPNLHEAVMRQPTKEYPEGTVIEELQRGYLLGERVLRHALVKVATAPEPEADSDSTGQSGQEG
jgi:molecular chaperone GrpE